MRERSRMEFARSMAHIFQDRLMEQGMRMTGHREAVSRACGYALARYDGEASINASEVRDHTCRFMVGETSYVPYSSVCRILREMASLDVVQLEPQNLDMRVSLP